VKRNVPAPIVMTFVLLAVPIGLAYAATKGVKPKPAKPTETVVAPVAKAKVHTVDVTLKKDDIGCYVAGPDCDDKVNDAQRGDVVRFNFKNECPLAVALHVGRFQPKYLGEKDAGNPLEGACLQDVRLKPQGSTSVDCRVKPLAVENRTYKYSILNGKRLLRDPQIEVVKP
jgi:hypothetical protein